MNSNQKGLCIWFTGLPCAGKTTLSTKLYEILKNNGNKVKLFDGDEVNKLLELQNFGHMIN